MDRDVSREPRPTSSPSPDAAASPREILAQQITSGNIDRSSLFSQLSSNPFFTAGFGLAALGFAARIFQKAITRGAALARRRLLVDVEVTHHDASYQWFLRWMSAYQRVQLSHTLAPHSSTSSNPNTKLPTLTSRMLARLTPGIHHLSINTTRTTLPNGAASTHFSLVPGQGQHILRYRNAFMLVSRQRDGKAYDVKTGTPFETITLTTLYAYRHIFAELFQDAHALAEREQEGKTRFYVPKHVQWEEFGAAKRKRPLTSVTLADGVKEGILEDVRHFLGARNWYLDRGIPYRRGYLLYGPPGTGKSSFIQALAGELNFNIAMLNLSQRGIQDDVLNVLLTNIPPRTLVLLEDADAAFVNRKQVESDGYSGATVTFSGLLNALDGVASAEERIVFLTTNHVERMDEALIRPGRIDMMVKLGEATQSQVEHMWDRFYGEEDIEGAGDPDGALKKAFVDKLRATGLLGQVSTAALQGLFLFNKGDARGAITGIEQLLPKHGTIGRQQQGSPEIQNTASETPRASHSTGRSHDQ